MSLLSMTGFASISREVPGALLSLDLRAVNHRYLDLQLRMPEDWRSLEGPMRERLQGKLTRGKVECRLSVQQTAQPNAELNLGWSLVEQLLQADRRIRELSPDSPPLSVGEVLRWPQVVQAQAGLSLEEQQNLVLGMLDEALGEFAASRAREGEKLGLYLLERVERMEQLVREIAPRIPQIVAAQQEKLLTRLRDALGKEDSERLHQEVVLFAQKIDVDEELGRLNAHLAEVRRIVKTGGTVGKRLDFLMQELNREANTLGSKSASVDTTGTAVEFKVLIEQMREQVQNIE
ncbi:MAG TPA: YicC/YloC family endoribonuclease [Candidatus Kapabacteria bacterium]|nr:YicC/YloC family endoribonuclease [Candidatus Kapabacteria bacterium]